MDIQDYITSMKENLAIVIEKDCYLKSWKVKLTWLPETLNTPLIDGLISPSHRINASLHKNQLVAGENAEQPCFNDGLFYTASNYGSILLNTLIGQNGVEGFKIPNNIQRSAGYYEELIYTFPEPIFLHKHNWLNVRLWKNEPYSLIDGVLDEIRPKVNLEFDIA